MTERPPDIATDRLRLVVLLPEELEALIDGDTQRAGIVAGVSFPSGWPTDPDARDGLPWHLRHLRADAAHRAWRVRAIVERSSREVIGAINLKGPPGRDGDVEIGWGVVEGRRRRGFAVEAAGAVIAWAASQPGVLGVSATVPQQNAASQRVAARLGMIRTSETRRDMPLWRRATIP